MSAVSMLQLHVLRLQPFQKKINSNTKNQKQVKSIKSNKNQNQCFNQENKNVSYNT
jgi:hypothetical protein